MRYDAERKVILISAQELVSIAARSVCGAGAEEPEGREFAEKKRAALLGAEAIGLTYSFSSQGYAFELSGRADRIDGDRLSLLASVEASAHSPYKNERELARGRAYILGYAYAATVGAESLTLEIIYVSRRSGEHAVKTEVASREALEKFFHRCTASLAKYARPEVERVTLRLPSMRDMKFPYSRVRDGQRELVRATYRALSRGDSLYACAPTGTGKTASVIFPALRLVGEGKRDKVFYLTPKTTTAKMAKECIELLAKEGANIRAIVLSSKENSCTEGMLCRRRAGLCRLGVAKLPDALLALYDLGITVVTTAEVRRVALEFSVCPYELALTYAELCDAVICDVNYLFDPRVYLRRFFDEGAGVRYSVLIDEAHNLADRAREMFSSELCCDLLAASLSSALIPQRSELCERGPGLVEAIRDALYPYVKDEIHEGTDGMEVGAANLSEMPSEIYPIAIELLTLLDAEYKQALRAKDEAAEDRIALIGDLFYEMRAFMRAADGQNGCYRSFIFYTGGDLRIKLFAMDTGPIIRSVLNRVGGAVFFSATLSPLDYYKSVLGGDGSSDELVAHSPFAPECLSVSIIDKISTRYSERERTLPAVARTIAAVMSQRRGKYMVFAPSFEYLDMIANAFEAKYPSIRSVRQRKDMTREERAAFLAEFEREGEKYLVGFCVLGGIYSEGIDLVGDSLIGAVVVGIGMPSLSYEREAMAEYFDEKYEAGKQYAYIYPGMNRVLQAAGRVIRTESDRGVIVLIDDRFADPIYKRIIPDLWEGMEYVGNAKELSERIKLFWQGVDEERGVVKSSKK